MNSRRKFLQSAGLLGLGASTGFDRRATERGGAVCAVVPTALKLGIAGYTFLHVPMDQGVAMMKRLGIEAFSIKDFYLPSDSDAGKMKDVVGTFQSAGIRIYGAGVIYMKSQQEVDRAFAYAKLLGVELIIGVPNPELLGYVEQKVRETGIRIAVHNHGPEDKLYPSPVDVWEHIKGLDERVGLCLDIGHAARAGADPVKAVRDYGARIFDLHIKDLAVLSRDYHPAVLGRGVLDIPGLLRVLKERRYDGYCSIEFEMDMNDPYPGIAESVGYFRGVLNGQG
jgi:inosose dehydratase